VLDRGEYTLGSEPALGRALMRTPQDPGELPTGDERRRALAAQLRSLVSMTVLTTVEDAKLARASALVEEALALLSGSARAGRYEGIAGLAPGATTNDRIWETHAAFGQSNPLAPPVTVDDHEGRVAGVVTFGGAWEGGPGTVYGGFVAAAFDGMLGRAVISAGHLGVTRSLEVRYLRPTPLHKELRIESVAGTRTGQRVPVSGRLWDGDVLTCEAEAVFACVPLGRYQA
jgi:acyl-coenzyme A thioesterase PaaI-like protein